MGGVRELRAAKCLLYCTCSVCFLLPLRRSIIACACIWSGCYSYSYCSSARRYSSSTRGHCSSTRSYCSSTRSYSYSYWEFILPTGSLHSYVGVFSIQFIYILKLYLVYYNFFNI